MPLYADVPQSEAENKDGTLKPGYERWAYSWKRVVPDTPEEVADREYWAALPALTKAGMKALPGWSTWTPGEAKTWITAHIPPVTDLPSAKAAIDGLRTAVETMAEAVIYLRDHAQITR